MLMVLLKAREFMKIIFMRKRRIIYGSVQEEEEEVINHQNTNHCSPSCRVAFLRCLYNEHLNCSSTWEYFWLPSLETFLPSVSNVLLNESMDPFCVPGVPLTKDIDHRAMTNDGRKLNMLLPSIWITCSTQAVFDRKIE